MQVLVTGATGFVGGHLVRRLVSMGHSCVAFARRPLPPSQGIVPFQGDVLNRGQLGEAAKGCQAAVHLVGIIREHPAMGITFDAVHVEATANVVYACKEAGVQLLVHLSALGACSESAARYHRTKFAAEELVREGGLGYSVIRPSLIIGPGARFVEDMRRMLSLRVVGLLPDRYEMQPVAVRDVVDVLAAALENPELQGSTWELCGPEVFNMKGLMRLMADTWGVRALFLPVPVSLLRALAVILDRFSWFPVTREQLTMLAEGSCCRDFRVFSVLGREPIPISEELCRCMVQ